jgi:hypothetical protein
MHYRLANGYSVRTATVEDGIEFVTSNPQNEVISTTRKTPAEAVPLLMRLRVAHHLNTMDRAR